MPNIFSQVRALHPGRSVFDLSYQHLLTCDMGQLIPIMCDEVVPGDVWEIGNEIVVRMQPLVAPVLHAINVYVHYFFVPYRIIWDDWEKFITGGINGADTTVLPRWTSPNSAIGTLWDYFGFPTGINPQGAEPLSFPCYAYNRIFNEYYRDETLDAEVAQNSEVVQLRRWKKDYFTSALPWQQRGTAPALPISGTTNAVFADGAFVNTTGGVSIGVDAGSGFNRFLINGADARNNAKGALNNNTVNLGAATTFNVADLRLAFQIQKWMERNARAGARYTEFLKAHFGVSPRDDRLQRPEYIGGSKAPVIVSEVLKTGSTDATSPQGNMAGHGLTASRNYAAKYHAQEYGLIMGIMSVMPDAVYMQGIDRQWLRKTKYDFYSPEFANLSEQAITNGELYCRNNETAWNTGIFGYQGRYDEMRIKKNIVSGLMRTDFNYWHMAREFANYTYLNSSFVTCNPTKRIFAAPSQPGLIVSVGNRIKAIRPLPIQSDPGLIDHS